MDEKSRPDLPTRSVSLDNLKPKSNLGKKLKFIDDTPTEMSYSTSESADEMIPGSGSELLLDLNNILRTKLRMDDSVTHVKAPGDMVVGSNMAHDEEEERFKERSGLEGDTMTKVYDDDINGCSRDQEEPKVNDIQLAAEQESGGIEDEEYDEDDEFANVDEIDGPVSGKQKELRDIDYNMPVDEEYKRSLDERAAEFDEASRFQPISQPKIEWSLQDFYSLQDDLEEWFCASEFNYLPLTKFQFEEKVNFQRFPQDDEYACEIIRRMCQTADENLSALTYISLGTFASAINLDEQLRNIRKYNLMLCEHLESIVDIFKKTAIACRDDMTNLRPKTGLLFYACTILFFVVNVCIEQRDKEPNTNVVKSAIDLLHKSGLLQFLTHYIEHWRWSSRLSMRIRNIINLLHKLLVLQFGDKSIWKKSKVFLYDLHNLKQPIRNDKGQHLAISPLHYQAFREDIVSRFPDYRAPLSGLPPETDNSNSLSQFLEIPRSKAKNPINLSLAIPEQHIATPAPSPPDSPTILQMDTLRHRKSFQTNMAFPCLYPSDDEGNEDDLSKRMSLDCYEKDPEIIVPYSIQEATQILSNSVHIKLSVQQLWYERDLFISTERGWKMKQGEDKYNYSKIENNSQDEPIEIMKRVDCFYNECFSSLNSLVFVLLQTVESNLSNVDYRNSDIPADTNIDPLVPRLEITRTKELAMKSCFGIFYTLLKWFKLNHVLKHEHLCVLLHDSHYIQVCCALLGKYSENYSEKAFNRMLSSPESIWKECSNYNPSYRCWFIGQQDTERSQKYNVPTLSSLAYMLRVLRKIVGDKTERLKELPLNIGLLFKRYYRIFNMDIYHPVLRIIRELAPFKNKRWKSEHMELISGVFLYEQLELIDNWVTGKDVSGELGDACGQEIALRALLQFYNFLHYEKSMEDLGYGRRPTLHLSLLNKESEYLGV